jgi:hypothetical protein
MLTSNMVSTATADRPRTAQLSGDASLADKRRGHDHSRDGRSWPLAGVSEVMLFASVILLGFRRRRSLRR